MAGVAVAEVEVGMVVGEGVQSLEGVGWERTWVVEWVVGRLVVEGGAVGCAGVMVRAVVLRQGWVAGIEVVTAVVEAVLGVAAVAAVCVWAHLVVAAPVA